MPKKPKTNPSAANSTTNSTDNTNQNHVAAPVTPASPPVLAPVHNNTQAPNPPDPEDHDDITEESEKNARKNKERKHDAGAADLERITDFAQETEISASDISAVMGLIGEEVAGRLAKEKELLKVKIRKEDVELLVREFEISEERAERHLREHSGNIIETLQTLTN